MMKKLLVTGASGFLGWNICQLAQHSWQVYGTVHTKTVTIPHTTVCPVDLGDSQGLRSLIEAIRPDGIIHTAAMSSPNRCQLEPETAYAINVTASHHLADLCAEWNIPCAFTSTDLVFDGQHPPYRETDPVCPINHYGEQKVLAEVGMRSRYPATAICRMPLMFGYAPYASSFIQPFLRTLREGNPLSLFTDEIRTPASGTTAAQGLLLALETVQGTLHLGGQEALSRYEFGQQLVEVLQLEGAKLTPCRQADVPMAAPRAPNTSLDSSYAFSLGYSPRSIRDELAALKGII